MPELLDTIEIENGKNPTASVIWLHGLGADGNDFAQRVPELRLPKAAIRFVFPHARVRPVTINGGMRMRAWYDITDGANRREDERGVRASQVLIEALNGREKERGTKAGRLVLAGFSQGGAIARSEEHTSELQSQSNLVCRLLLEKKKKYLYERQSEV